MQTAAVMPARNVSCLAMDAVGFLATRQMIAAAVSMIVMMAAVEPMGGSATIPISSEVTVAYVTASSRAARKMRRAGTAAGAAL